MVLPLRQLCICVKQMTSQSYSEPVYVDIKKTPMWLKVTEITPVFHHNVLSPYSALNWSNHVKPTCLCVEGDPLYLQLLSDGSVKTQQCSNIMNTRLLNSLSCINSLTHRHYHPKGGFLLKNKMGDDFVSVT